MTRSSDAGVQQFFAFDRKAGREVLKLPPGPYRYPRVSPDGKRLAFESSDGKEAFVAVYDVSGTSSPRRLTFGGNNRFPVWSRDGTHVAFQSDRARDPAVFWQAVEGGVAEQLTRPEPGTSHVPERWSPTGDVLLFDVVDKAKTSLWTLSIRDRNSAPFGDVTSAVIPTNAVFSPDGRWVAYQAGERGSGAKAASSCSRSHLPAPWAPALVAHRRGAVAQRIARHLGCPGTCRRRIRL